MKAKLIDRGAAYEFDDMRKVSIKDKKLTIEYYDKNGEHHVELGFIPDELVVEDNK